MYLKMFSFIREMITVLSSVQPSSILTSISSKHHDAFSFLLSLKLGTKTNALLMYTAIRSPIPRILSTFQPYHRQQSHWHNLIVKLSSSVWYLNLLHEPSNKNCLFTSRRLRRQSPVEDSGVSHLAVQKESVCLLTYDSCGIQKIYIIRHKIWLWNYQFWVELGELWLQVLDFCWFSWFFLHSLLLYLQTCLPILKGCSQQMASCLDLRVLKSDDMPL